MPLQFLPDSVDLGSETFLVRQSREVFAHQDFVGQVVLGVADEGTAFSGAEDDVDRGIAVMTEFKARAVVRLAASSSSTTPERTQS